MAGVEVEVKHVSADIETCLAGKTVDFSIRKIVDTKTWFPIGVPITRYCPIGMREITIRFMHGQMIVEGCDESGNVRPENRLPKCDYLLKKPNKKST